MRAAAVAAVIEGRGRRGAGCRQDAGNIADCAAEDSARTADQEVEAKAAGFGAVDLGHHHVQLHLHDAADAHRIDDPVGAAHEGNGGAHHDIHVFSPAKRTGDDDTAVGGRQKLEGSGWHRLPQGGAEILHIKLHDDINDFLGAGFIDQGDLRRAAVIAAAALSRPVTRTDLGSS